MRERRPDIGQSAMAWVMAALSAILLMLGSASVQAGGMADTVKDHVNTSSIVHYTTGINPDDYPCAKARITKLYENRGKMADLSRWHPKRIFTWIVDTSVYYTMRFVDFLKGLMNPDTVVNGIHSIARGGNPLRGMDSKVSGWVRDLSPSSQYALQRKVRGIIEDTTNADGSCKG